MPDGNVSFLQHHSLLPVMIAMLPQVLGASRKSYRRLASVAQSRLQPPLLSPGTWSHEDLCGGACTLDTLAAGFINWPG
jgi:hypothetical protein